MTVAAPALFAFDNTYVRELPGLYAPFTGAAAPDPRLLVLNTGLAAELGADPAALAAPGGVAVLAGSAVPEGAEPVAMAYAGHQFGGYSPQLGDGRALLLGEVVDVRGRRRDVHLKGSGRTPFARAGDGKAVVGPMLREYLVSEAMHALGIPTTRALAVVATGEQVARGPLLPGAVLTRVAASHLRVGTFEYAARRDPDLLRRLADYAIARHHPEAADAESPYLALLEHVVAAQASLIAAWMAVGFVHGVMNTDNMTISGETIDYGPCAFIDAFDPAAVFSSIDHAGRYAFGNQPHIAQWNLARFAETLLPLIGSDAQAAAEAATAVLHSFPGRFSAAWAPLMLAKLGLSEAAGDAGTVVDDLLTLLHEQHVDYTAVFRALSADLRGTEKARDRFVDPAAFDAWAARWRALLPDDTVTVAEAMDRVNPVYIPRNHLVEDALTEATVGELDPFVRLLEAVTKPFDERPGLEAYAEPAPKDFGDYVTYCGT